MSNDDIPQHDKDRDKKIHKRKHGMRVSGRSIKSVLLPLIKKKGEKNA